MKTFTIEKAEEIVAKYADRTDLDVRIYRGRLQTRRPGGRFSTYAAINGYTVHKFEAAGLGKAPFQFVGISTNVGPKPGPNGTQIGAPGQPMGTCDYCGTGIKFEYHIRSADGREFVVGSSCIFKTGDGNLAEIARREESKQDREKRERARQKREERACRREQEAQEALGRDDVRKALEAQESPTGRGTALEYCDFIFSDGRYGSSTAVSIVHRIIKEVTA